MRYVVEKYKNSPRVLEGACITFGIFDGAHEGHKYEIEQTRADARANSTHSAIVTFDIDPDEKFIRNFCKLMTNEERLNALEKSGVDDLIVLEFNEELQHAEPQDFLNNFFGKNLPQSIHVGTNFTFGAHAKGTTGILIDWGKQHDVKVYAHDLIKKDGKVVSSTAIRQELKGKK